ncbi:MAG: hypothetical protein E3J75_00990 [Dehalococcoidia bacterium]|nr:MAG: hypothetical protein E3J75_00990 [Dehalococcoidia bacterium]
MDGKGEEVNKKEHLKNFYHDDFTNLLPEDSRLHKILTVDLPQTENLRIEINNCLELAHRYTLLDADLEARLRSPDGQIWQSAMNELRVALQFENLFGTNCLRWHPQGREKKVGEFELLIADMPVFIEVKSIFPREIEELERRLKDKLFKSVENIPFPFALDIQVREIGDSENFSISKFRQFLKCELSKIDYENNEEFQLKLPNYRDPSTGTLLEIEILPVSPKPAQESSYIGCVGGEARFIHNEDYIRHSLSKAYAQLPKGYQPSLVILCSETEFPIGERNMLNVVLGTLAYRIYRHSNGTPAKAESIRKPDGFFRPDRNRQLSAIGLFARKYTEESIEQTLEIYHNPFAGNPMDYTIFREKGVRQLTKKNDREMEWVD